MDSSSLIPGTQTVANCKVNATMIEDTCLPTCRVTDTQLDMHRRVYEYEMLHFVHELPGLLIRVGAWAQTRLSAPSSPGCMCASHRFILRPTPLLPWWVHGICIWKGGCHLCGRETTAYRASPSIPEIVKNRNNVRRKGSRALHSA